MKTAAIRQTENLWLAALLGLTVLRLILAATLPVAPDEAYYWLWSQHLQPGYYDHPPMVALFIRIGTALFGATPFGIRLFGPLAAAAQCGVGRVDLENLDFDRVAEILNKDLLLSSPLCNF